MPYCTSCGNKVEIADSFCAGCGTRQLLAANRQGVPYGVPFSAPGRVAVNDPLASVSPRTLSILCYVPVVGWIASVIVLGAKRFRADQALRFHAFQGLYIFAAWLLDDWAIKPIFSNLPRHIFRVDELLQTVLMFVWIFMMVKTSRGEAYSLPILGELAQRSAQERG